MVITLNGIAGVRARNDLRMLFFHGWPFISRVLRHYLELAGYELTYMGERTKLLFCFPSSRDMVRFVRTAREYVRIAAINDEWRASAAELVDIPESNLTQSPQ